LKSSKKLHRYFWRVQ